MNVFLFNSFGLNTIFRFLFFSFYLSLLRYILDFGVCEACMNDKCEAVATELTGYSRRHNNSRSSQQ